ncbi:hypothetical protein OMF40_08560, partial [Bordetella pertussis]
MGGVERRVVAQMGGDEPGRELGVELGCIDARGQAQYLVRVLGRARQHGGARRRGEHGLLVHHLG